MSSKESKKLSLKEIQEIKNDFPESWPRLITFY